MNRPPYPQHNKPAAQANQPLLTMRDVFAASAIQGICTLETGSYTPEQLAKEAYVMADAMLKARKGDV